MSVTTIINQIYNIECPTLDIGDRKGWTGYIDFISEDEFNEPVRKGVDIYGRRFISFKATIHYANGESHKTFTTLFQRYCDNEYLWMTAGQIPKTRLLLDTTGGASLKQLRFILELLKNGSVDVTEDILYTCKIEPYIRCVNEYDDCKAKTEPVKISTF